MIIFSLVFFFLSSLKQVQADFTSSFHILDNKINFSLPVLTNSQEDQSLSKNYLSFFYKVNYSGIFLDDLPIFTLAINDQLIFYETSFCEKEIWQEVTIDIQDLDFEDQLPIIYKNLQTSDLKVEIKDFSFQESILTIPNKTEIKDLLLIREEDQSLTVVFSAIQELRFLERFQLVCLDQAENILEEIPLLDSNNFLFPELVFRDFYPNRENEVIFNITDPACENNLAVYSINQSGEKSKQSELSTVINIEDLKE